MKQDSYITDLLGRIKELNPDAFEEFASKHAICFQPKKGNWLFPMMFDYYVNIINIKDDAIIEVHPRIALVLSCSPSSSSVKYSSSL